MNKNELFKILDGINTNAEFIRRVFDDSIHSCTDKDGRMDLTKLDTEFLRFCIYDNLRIIQGSVDMIKDKLKA